MMNNGEEKNLSSKQRAAIAALLGGANKQTAATAAGVHINTFSRWQQQPVFKAALREAEAEALDEAARKLLALASAASAALMTVLHNPDAPLSLQLRAADIVLSRLLQLRELATIEERLTRLEREVNEKSENTA